ncbi:vWA domain-containing protein, partial [Anaeromicrobium sediminis]
MRRLLSWIMALMIIITVMPNAAMAESIPNDIVSSAIRSADAEEYGIGDTGVIKYEISGDEVKLPESLTGITEKEIVLVIDTSGSMGTYMGFGRNRKSRMEITKDAAKNFINKFSNKSNVKIGIVAYSEKGHITSDLKLASDYSLIRKINSLQPDSATNTGDGLRLAYWMLKNSSNSNAKKYVVS